MHTGASIRERVTEAVPVTVPAALPDGSPAQLRLEPPACEEAPERAADRPARVRRSLAIADLAAVTAAWCLTALLTDPGDSGRPPVALIAASLPGWIAVGRAYGLHRADVERASSTTADDAVRLFHPVIVGTIALYAGVRLAGLDATPETFTVYAAVALPALVAGRACARAVMRRQRGCAQTVVVVGAGTTGQLVASKLVHGARGVEFLGFVDDEPPEGARCLGDLESLPAVVRQLDVERVIVALPAASSAQLLTLLRPLDELPVHVDIVPRLFEALGPRADLHELCGLPLVGLPPRDRSPAAVASRRLLDVAGSALLVVALAPLIAAIAVAVKLTSRGPVFYRGARIGRHGTRFRLFKFRTMSVEYCRGPEYGGEDAEAAFRELMNDPARRAQFERAHKLDGDPRVTPLGELLRRTSLDELPQLFNVLKGDLALVGPRPITAEEYDDLLGSGSAELPTDPYWTVEGLRPGMTGYWQINGRSSTSYEERLRLDNAYATSRSIQLDLLILAKTGSALLDRRNTC